MFHSHTFSNGLTLLGEKMEHVSSVAVSFLTPFGAATDPIGKEGLASVLTEMFNKGAASYSARQLSQEYEDLGIHRNMSSGIEVSVFSMAMLSENLERALELMKIQLLEPSLPEEELPSVISLALQDLKALEDEPASLAMQKLSENFYTSPFNRSQYGTVEGISNLTIDCLREHHSERLVPSPSIISVAGKFEWNEVVSTVEKLFGTWTGDVDLLPITSYGQKEQVIHVEKDTSQVQIAFAYPSVTHESDFHPTAKVANGILSGGMSGRLFVEVREKRGLVYRVSSSHSSGRGRGGVFASAGTTPENADETLQVMLQEVSGLADGASDEELARSKADINSRLMIQSESSSSRASSLINDWWNLGRVRSLDEVKSGINSVTSENIREYYKKYPVRPLTLVALGPKALQVPV